MLKNVVISASLVFSLSSVAQEPTAPSELDTLKAKVKELEEIQRENSEMIKLQLADQHLDQNSRGYLELKAGASMFEPKDIEDLNEEQFDDLDDASWKSFGHGKIVDLEVGKTLFSGGLVKHDIGIGYQFFHSQATADYTPNGGGGSIKVIEKIMIHTMFARYAALFKINSNGKFHFGPGVTFGYSPVGKMDINIEQGNQGTKISAEGTSYLVEIFGKGKYEFSRYFSFVFTGGYRMQKVDDLRFSEGDIVTMKTKIDLDASGVFATGGLAVSF